MQIAPPAFPLRAAVAAFGERDRHSAGREHRLPCDHEHLDVVLRIGRPQALKPKLPAAAVRPLAPARARDEAAGLFAKSETPLFVEMAAVTLAQKATALSSSRRMA